MIILRDILLQFGERTLFDHINAHITFDLKIGVVGRNGAGKSTLLEVITRNLPVDEGEIVTDKKQTIAYFPQHIVLNSTKSVFDEAYYVFHVFIEAKKRVAAIEKELETSPDNAEQLLEEYTDLLDKLKQFDEVRALARTHEVLNGLGFSEKQKGEPVSTLSVGWKMRIVLAKLLLSDADFYLFDEPTNHLDLSTKEWFCDYLTHAPFGFLLVTHDRYFLEKACSKMFELENGKGTMYDGNFSSYINQKERTREITKAAYEAQKKEIDRKQETINRFRATASKATMVKSMVKQLDKIERIEIEPPLPKIRITFPPVTQPGKTVLTLKDLSYSFPSSTSHSGASGQAGRTENKKIFDHISATIMRGQKVALVAPNGMGKTTLFNVISGKYPLQTGSIELGYNVKSAFFEQEQGTVMTGTNTIYEEVSRACPDQREETIRMFLGSFLFSGSDIHKKISMLSGGEKNRVAMVKVLLQKANLLLLDEPTNHLDLITKEILLQALQQYQGTMLIVSHDHLFIEKLATDILELMPDGLHHFPGSYEAYLDYKKSYSAEASKDRATPTTLPTASPQSTPLAPTKVESKDMQELRKRIAKIEKTIAKLEEDKKNLSDSFANLTYGTDGYNDAVRKLDMTQKELRQKTIDWENLQKRLDLE